MADAVSEDELEYCNMEAVEDEFYNNSDSELMDQDGGRGNDNEAAGTVDISSDDNDDAGGAEAADAGDNSVATSGDEAAGTPGDEAAATPGDEAAATPGDKTKKPKVKSTV